MCRRTSSLLETLEPDRFFEPGEDWEWRGGRRGSLEGEDEFPTGKFWGRRWWTFDGFSLIGTDFLLIHIWLLLACHMYNCRAAVEHRSPRVCSAFLQLRVVTLPFRAISRHREPHCWGGRSCFAVLCAWRLQRSTSLEIQHRFVYRCEFPAFSEMPRKNYQGHE